MKLYVYYNPIDGIIQSIGPEPQSDKTTYVMLDTLACDALYAGKGLVAKHRIIHETLVDTVTDLLVNHGPLPEPSPTIHNYGHQRVFHVPTVEVLNPTTDLTIENNISTKELKLILGPWADKKAILNLRLFFTSTDNPFDFRGNRPFELTPNTVWPYEMDLTDISVWTYRIFETYQYWEHA